MIDEILQRVGLKYDDLNSAERETLNVWVSAIQKSEVTPDKVRDYIIEMRRSVEDQLTKYKNSRTRDLFLKARLRNYLLLEAFLATPEKAKQKLEEAVAGMTPMKV